MTQAFPTVHSLSGAYALDALPEIERRQFEEHLAECGDCARELRGLRATAARLGTAAARPAPPGLRERVLAEISRTRQEVPLAAWARRGRRSGRGFPPGPLTLAAAACLLVAVALGVITVRAQDRLERVEARQRQVESVLAAPDARTVSGPVRTGGTGTVVVSRQTGRAVVIMSGLPVPPARRTYELWLLGTGQPRPAGLTDTGSATVVVNGVGKAGGGIGITIEPTGGSPRPTTDPVFAADLPV
ncbi:anti-sigma factor domain-containing protein [Spirillospora sp. NPDC048911]|uniref:anti-sigma factor n=1 Tax=Spirillospora sp. NPDC048911 TaxID=3364527 RepID=UPI00371DA5EC